MDTGAAAMLGLFTFLAVSSWASSRRKEREMEFRHDLYRRMMEHPGPEADAVRELLAQDEQRRQAAAAAAKREGALTMLALGIGLGVFLYFIAPGKSVYLVALMPMSIGVISLLSGGAGLRQRKDSPP
jgi:hypothetical protein